MNRYEYKARAFKMLADAAYHTQRGHWMAARVCRLHAAAYFRKASRAAI